MKPKAFFRLWLSLFLLACSGLAQSGGELRFCLRAEPKTFHPALVSEESSETIAYLTGGVLIRVNRQTQQLEPELAVSWKTARDGKSISFELRPGVSFSDGTPFSADDVAFTFQTLMDPALHSPVGDAFRSGSGPVRVVKTGKLQATIHFPAPVAGVERHFDQVAILSAHSPLKEKASLGPFRIAEHKPGVHVLLGRNPHYWKKDSSGRRLPYLDAIRLEIQQNRDLELMRFQRGQLHLVNTLDPDHFDRMASGSRATDVGPGMDVELLWFNQTPQAPIPAYRKAWFGNTAFRRAVSEAIHRADMARIVFRGHARPAVGPVSPANQFWFNSKLKTHPYDPQGALRRLTQEGFRKEGEWLKDREGNAVEFSVITNAGNRSRERMAAMIQEDLRKIGIRLNVVTLDFPSLIERISRNFQYEACLLGLVNVDLDPSGQMNVWLSSSSQHPWYPGQKSPATPWEAEIDKLMRAQASALDRNQRKAHFDKVQEIVWNQAPILYLVNKNVLVAVSPSLKNTKPAVLRPQTYWNAEWLHFDGDGKLQARQ